MNQEPASDGSFAQSRSEQVRHLGFNPAFLTAEEQDELLVIEAALGGADQELDQVLVQM